MKITVNGNWMPPWLLWTAPTFSIALLGLAPTPTTPTNPIATTSCSVYSAGGRPDLAALCGKFPNGPRFNFIRGCLQANFNQSQGVYNEVPNFPYSLLLGPLAPFELQGYGINTHAYCIARGLFYGQ